MNVEKHILLLRLSYWIAAIADFVIAGLALVPERMGLSSIAYPMGMTSAVVFSWGAMLIIADRKPLDRHWMLIPTILVVGLLTLVKLIFWGTSPVAFNLFSLCFGVSLMTLMGYSYLCASRVLSVEK